MKLYRWDSFSRVFTATVLQDYMPLQDRVVLQGHRLDKGKRLKATVNSEDSLICLLTGSWCVNIANRQLIVHYDEAVIIPSGFEHSVEAIEDSFAVQVVNEKESGDQYLWGV
jgi:hypothetical protein